MGLLGALNILFTVIKRNGRAFLRNKWAELVRDGILEVSLFFRTYVLMTYSTVAAVAGAVWLGVLPIGE